MKKTFDNLPPHYGVHVNVEFWTGDSWDNEKYGVKLDGIEVFSARTSYKKLKFSKISTFILYFSIRYVATSIDAFCGAGFPIAMADIIKPINTPF